MNLQMTYDLPNAEKRCREGEKEYEDNGSVLA